MTKKGREAPKLDVEDDEANVIDETPVNKIVNNKKIKQSVSYGTDAADL